MWSSSRRDNWLKLGENMHLARKLGEGREGYDQAMASAQQLMNAYKVGLEVPRISTPNARNIKIRAVKVRQWHRYVCHDPWQRYCRFGHGCRDYQDERRWALSTYWLARLIWAPVLTPFWRKWPLSSWACRSPISSFILRTRISHRSTKALTPAPPRTSAAARL